MFNSYIIAQKKAGVEVNELKGLVMSVKHEMSMMCCEVNDLRGELQATSDQITAANSEVHYNIISSR